MKYNFSYLLMILLATGCSKPVANFLVKEDTVATSPAELHFKNNSKKADSFEWTVNGNLAGKEKDLNYFFTSSGRYTIELKAFKGDKSHSFEEEVFISAPQNCQVYMKTTFGDMVLELSDETPIHQKNFLDLVEAGYYNGLAFHRIIDGFIIQAGDVKKRKSKYDKKIPGLLPKEFHTHFFHIRGALAAARMPNDMNPEKKSSGTQFYIVDGRSITREKLEDIESGKLFDYSEDDIIKYIENGGTPQLDGEYTIFGHLISGFETLDKISEVKTSAKNQPLEEVLIIEAKILD